MKIRKGSPCASAPKNGHLFISPILFAIAPFFLGRRQVGFFFFSTPELQTTYFRCAGFSLFDHWRARQAADTVQMCTDVQSSCGPLVFCFFLLAFLAKADVKSSRAMAGKMLDVLEFCLSPALVVTRSGHLILVETDEHVNTLKKIK